MRSNRLTKTFAVRIGLMMLFAVAGSPILLAQAGHNHEHHGDEGPHHGQLVKLTKANFQAELVHDEKSKTVVVYLLDSTAKRYVVTDSKEVTISFTSGNKAAKFALAGTAEKNKRASGFSKFVSKDAKLGESLHKGGGQGTLTVTLAEKTYTGKIEEHHDHDAEHDHDHDDGGSKEKSKS